MLIPVQRDSWKGGQNSRAYNAFAEYLHWHDCLDCSGYVNKPFRMLVGGQELEKDSRD